MTPEKILEQLRNHFSDAGFNLTLAIKAYDYGDNTEAILPKARSIILVGFGGNKFWKIFQKYLEDNPEFRINSNDIIDDYSALKFKEAKNLLELNNIRYKFAYPFGDNALDFNFLKLGELGGAGVPSLLGILLHPVYGPWISLRGAIITDMDLDNFVEPISGFSPCPSCDKPCISACPANTISESGWDWASCMKFRISDKTCAVSCASRRACPYGQEEQYTEEQLNYHHKYVLESAKEYFDQED